MLDYIQIACGSVIGKDHLSNGKVLIGRNNQDAFKVKRGKGIIAAFVNDGCGSGAHSEVGAWIAANALAESIVVRYDDKPTPSNPSHHLERCRKDVLSVIRITANSFGGSFSQTINDYFLFTTVGILITEEMTQIVAIGDGVFAIEPLRTFMSNGTLQNLGPFPGNMPPYMAYDLVESSIDPDLTRFKIVAEMPTTNFGAAMIGSDGCEDLHAAAQTEIPGSNESVGALWQFWRDDSYFTNPDALQRRLKRCNAEDKRLNKETQRIDTHNRLLPDDTTIISVRKSPELLKRLPPMVDYAQPPKPDPLGDDVVEVGASNET